MDNFIGYCYTKLHEAQKYLGEKILLINLHLWN